MPVMPIPYFLMILTPKSLLSSSRTTSWSAQNVSAPGPRKALGTPAVHQLSLPRAPSSTGSRQSAAKASSQRGSRVSLNVRKVPAVLRVSKPQPQCALARPRPASSRSTSVPGRCASPVSRRRAPSVSSKDALKTSLRSIPTVSAKASVQSVPAMWNCPYCPRQCPTQVGLSVHLARWCKRNPSGTGWVSPQSIGSLSRASKAPMQAPVVPRHGDHKVEPLVQSTPAVLRRGAAAPPPSAPVAQPFEPRRGSKVSSQKATPASFQFAYPGSSKRALVVSGHSAASVSLQSDPAVAPSAKPLSRSASNIRRSIGRI